MTHYQEAYYLDKEAEVSFLPMEAIGEDGLLNLAKTRPISAVENGYTYFAEGDVAVAKITPCFENGKGAVMRGLANSIGFGTTELTIIRPGPNADIQYMYYLSVSQPFRRLGEATMYGAGGQKRVPDDFMRNFDLAWPPPSEQRAIAAFLDCETAKIGILVGKAQHAIELLREHRTSLIAAAVTGKIDVRAAGSAAGSTETLSPAPESSGALYLSAVELLKLPRKEREHILTRAVAEAEAVYRTDRELTDFEAFGEDDLYDETPEE